MWVKHLLSSEQSVFDLQLQQNLNFFRYIMFPLCADNSILSHADVFLWKILCRGYSFGKWLFTSFKNIFPTFVFAFNENGEFNHIIFYYFFCTFSFLRCHVQLCYVLLVKVSLKPLFLSVSEYVGIELRKMYSSDEISDIRLTIDFGSCFRTTGGWLDFLLMETSVLSDFLYGW